MELLIIFSLSWYAINPNYLMLINSVKKLTKNAKNFKSYSNMNSIYVHHRKYVLNKNMSICIQYTCLIADSDWSS